MLSLKIQNSCFIIPSKPTCLLTSPMLKKDKMCWIFLFLSLVCLVLPQCKKFELGCSFDFLLEKYQRFVF